MTLSPVVRRLCLPAIVASQLTAAIAGLEQSAHAETAKKTAEDFESRAWVPDPYNNATGQLQLAGEAGATSSLLIEPSFAGSFAGFAATPARPLVVPGVTRSVSVRFKMDDLRYGAKVLFRDGWGRDHAGGKPLTWQLPTAGATDWKTLTFTVPNDWVQPIQIAGIVVDNWEAKGDKKKPRVWIDQIDVETDLADVDPKTGALNSWKPEPQPADPAKALKTAPAAGLVQIDFSTAADGNVFTGGTPQASVSVRNWKPQPLTGELKYKILDDKAAVVDSGQQALNVESNAGVVVPLKSGRFGLYTLEADVALSDGTTQSRKMTYALVPEPRKLTEAQKQLSPYGINFHSADPQALRPFTSAGLVWFREYAFTYPRLLQSKGAGQYNAWPYLPKMAKAYEDAGAIPVAVLQQSVIKPAVENGKVVGPLGPSSEWTRNITHAVLSFPSIKYWEMSNEYDLPTANSQAEELVNWENYKKYHIKLANIADLLGDGKLTVVENGRAGIFPGLVRDCVLSGAFDKVAVVNSHHYTGTDAPEVNYLNYNTHSDVLLSQDPALFFDQLRATTRAGRADGKNRQHWLTEFGWDTLAGPVVSPYEQAVFLQRAWMLTLAAGCERSFWFYHFDSPKPAGFFDGCGLMTADRQPKLSLAAMAGISSILPTPRYVGTLSAGDNTAGYVFEQDGKFVAALFTIHGDNGPTITFNAEKVIDYLGNDISGKRATLSMAPIYVVGIRKDDPFYQQTAYSLDTPYLVAAAQGDPVKPVMQIDNNRSSPIQCTISFQLPAGWTASQTSIQATVEPGQKKLVELPVTIGKEETPGMKGFKIVVTENGAAKDGVAKNSPVATIEQKVAVRLPLAMKVASLAGNAGEAKSNVRILNQSTIARSGVVRLKLPAAWQAAVREVEVKDIKPGETREVPIGFTWNTDFKPGEAAVVEFDEPASNPIQQPIIPSEFRLHAASHLKLDADLADWPAATQLPSWLLGCTLGQPNAEVRMAWAKEGLYIGLDVKDSKIENRDPDSFWTADALELFLDTGDNKKARTFEVGDHQFWFVPMVDQQKVYAGRWKVKNEIPATLSNLQQVQGVSRRTADGYVLECLVPADLMQNYQPEAGKSLAINFNLRVVSRSSTREIYWPRTKSAGVQSQPQNWGSLKLVP